MRCPGSFNILGFTGFYHKPVRPNDKKPILTLLAVALTVLQMHLYDRVEIVYISIRRDTRYPSVDLTAHPVNVGGRLLPVEIALAMAGDAYAIANSGTGGK